MIFLSPSQFGFKAAFCHIVILLSREFYSKSSPDLIYSITRDHLPSSNVVAQCIKNYLERQCELTKDQTLWLYRWTDRICILKLKRFVKQVFYPDGDEPISFR